MSTQDSITILAIETSCDDTSVSVVRADVNGIVPLAHVVSSQITLHAPYGGVVPKLAARAHLDNITPTIDHALKMSGTAMKDLTVIATTRGPGLLPSLIVGATTAKTLAWRFQKPLIGVHHIAGHIYANFIGAHSLSADALPFPLLALVVSGGHTQLVFMERHNTYRIIGETQDDAVGEAFDKAARLLGLPYPGGPALSAAAATFTHDPNIPSVVLPRPMLHSGDFNFSFSGLKTAVLYYVDQHKHLLSSEKFVAAVAHEFQEAAVDVLVSKTCAATKKFRPRTVVLAGGVSANTLLRTRLRTAVASLPHAPHYNEPALTYCTDNATMIAAAAAAQWFYNATTRTDSATHWSRLVPQAELSLENMR